MPVDSQKDQPQPSTSAQETFSIKQETIMSQFEPYEAKPSLLELQQPQQSFDMSRLPTYHPKESTTQPQQQQQPSSFNPQSSPLERLKFTQPLSPTLSETGNLHDDLAISDSNDEDQNRLKTENDNDDDGDGLWF